MNIPDDKVKRSPNNIPQAAVLLILVNLVIALIVLPVAVMSREDRQDLIPYALFSIIIIPALMGVMLLLYRAYWWGLGCLFTVVTIILVGLFALMVMNEIPFRMMINRLIGL